MKSTLLNKNGGNRSFTFIKLCFYYKTSCRTLRICFQFTYLCCKKDHFQKIIDTFSCLGRYGNKYCAAAPVFRNQFIFRKLLLYTLNICTWFINFVNSYNDLHTCCLCMTDCLHCLRHNTIIRRNHKYSNICGICASHTHGGKCFMTGSIKECDFLIIDLYNICTNMLSNTTCFSSCYIRVSDCIQQRSLTMVNMTHDTYYRGSGFHCGFIFVLFF